MLVIYKSVQQAVREAVTEADKCQRRIAYIAMQQYELDELIRELNPFNDWAEIGKIYKSNELVGHLYGVEIRKA